MKVWKRIMLGALAAPWAAGVLVPLFFLLTIAGAAVMDGSFAAHYRELFDWQFAEFFILVSLIGASFGYAFMIFLFLPMFFLLRLRGWTGSIVMSALGYFCGTLVGLMMFEWGNDAGGMPEVGVWLILQLYALNGLAVGWTFWRLAVCAQPPPASLQT